MTQKQIATREAYGAALAKLGETRKDLVVLDADLSGSTKTGVFAKAFPQRFFNMGVAEQDLMGTAAGFAAMGKLVFASTFAIFATGRAWEVVRQSIAYPHLNVKIAATHAGLTVGEDGASHQALEDIAVMRAIPGMTVLVPADAVETEQLIEAAAAHDGPCYIRLSRAKTDVLFDATYRFAIGKANCLVEGRDVLLVACGVMVAEALKAAAILREQGISAAVLNMASVKPLDAEALVALARPVRAVFTIEEHSIIGGLGGAVAECLGEQLPKPLYRLGMRDSFGESGEATQLLARYHLTAPLLAEEIKRQLKGRG